MSDQRAPGEERNGREDAASAGGPSGAVTAPHEGLFDAAAGVVVEPVGTFRRLTWHPHIAWAVIVIAVTSALGWAASAAQLTGAGDPFAGDLAEFGDFGGDLSEYRAIAVVGALIGGPLFGLAFAAVGAGILHLVARLLNGSGSYEGMFVGVGFASIPQLLGVPFQLLGNLGTGGQLVAGLASFGTSIWALVLLGIAIRENNRFSTGRAIATLAIPLVGFLVLVVVLGVLLAALLIGGL